MFERSPEISEIIKQRLLDSMTVSSKKRSATPTHLDQTRHASYDFGKINKRGADDMKDDLEISRLPCIKKTKIGFKSAPYTKTWQSSKNHKITNEKIQISNKDKHEEPTYKQYGGQRLQEKNMQFYTSRIGNVVQMKFNIRRRQ